MDLSYRTLARFGMSTKPGQAQSDETAAYLVRQLPFGKAERYARLVKGSRIGQRHVALPVDELLSMSGRTARQEAYTRIALELTSGAALEALESAGVSGKEIDAIVVVSCTGY